MGTHLIWLEFKSLARGQLILSPSKEENCMGRD